MIYDMLFNIIIKLFRKMYTYLVIILYNYNDLIYNIGISKVVTIHNCDNT